MKTIAMAELTNLTRSASYNGREVWQLQLNGCELSVAQMPVFQFTTPLTFLRGVTATACATNGA
ncbi:MAG: hypothetical protein DMD30_04685 [Gemmatimonadetes bacterium]|nr:MAG: hypothetical protein DMD30_04685 [Gemmatimonadota bacterium]